LLTLKWDSASVDRPQQYWRINRLTFDLKQSRFSLDQSCAMFGSVTENNVCSLSPRKDHGDLLATARKPGVGSQ